MSNTVAQPLEKEDVFDVDTFNSEHHKQSYPTTRFSKRVLQNNDKSNIVFASERQAYPLANTEGLTPAQGNFDESSARNTHQQLNKYLPCSPVNADIENNNEPFSRFSEHKFGNLHDFGDGENQEQEKVQNHDENLILNHDQYFDERNHNIHFEQNPTDGEIYPDTGGADDIGLYNEDGFLDENAAFLAQHNSEHSGFGDNSERSSDEVHSEGVEEEDINVDLDLRVGDEEACESDIDLHSNTPGKNNKRLESSPRSTRVCKSTAKKLILNRDKDDLDNGDLNMKDELWVSAPTPTSRMPKAPKALLDAFKDESVSQNVTSNTFKNASKSASKNAPKSTKSASKSREKSTPAEGFSFPECVGKYNVLKKIGYGSFSEVYKAISLPHKRTFVTKRVIDGNGASRIVSILPSEFYLNSPSSSFSPSSSILKSKQDTFDKYKEFIEKPLSTELSPDNNTSSETKTKPIHTFSHIEVDVPGGQLVALKRITLTTSATRALAEALFLRRLGAHPYIASLHFIEIDPESGQITLVLPFVEHTSFREYYNNMSLTEIQLYMYALFSAIAHLEKHKVLHRDIKPSNFLYNRKTGEFCLVDLGLSQMFSHLDADEANATLGGTIPNTTSSRSTSEIKTDLDEVINRILAVESSSLKSSSLTPQIQVFDLSVPDSSPLTAEILASNRTQSVSSNTSSSPLHDSTEKEKSKPASISVHSISSSSIPPRRPIPAVPRWGTRGFRAPEVLLRSRLPQTSALDVWSAGITLLTILSQRYPVLNSADDLSGLAEILRLWGRTEMELKDRSVVLENAAVLRGGLRTFIHFCCPLVRWPEEVIDLCEKALDLDPEKRLTAVEALSHPFFAMDGRPCDREIAKTVRLFIREKSSKSKTDKKIAIKA